MAVTAKSIETASVIPGAYLAFVLAMWASTDALSPIHSMKLGAVAGEAGTGAWNR